MKSGKKYFQIITALAVGVLASVWLTQSALAAGGTIYLSPSSQSVKSGSNFTVSLRVNPGMNIDTVTANISYDAAKVDVVGIDCSGSPFTAFPSCPTGGNPISITGAKLGGSVNTDSLVAKVTFRAKVGSGSMNIGLSGNNATSGTSNNPAVTSASVNFSTPACASGQTGTYPNCVTPSKSAPGGSSNNSTPKGANANKSPASSANSAAPTTSGGSSSSTAAATAPVAAANAPKVRVTSKDVQFSTAKLQLASDVPTQVYVRYSTDKQNYIDTALTAAGTSHEVALDPSTLVPGTTYYYVIVSKDQQGQTSQTEVESLRTKGLTVTVGVFDKNGKPFKNKEVTLHSDPYTVKTDGAGFATYKDVAAGTHHLSYKDGDKEYSKEILVSNTVKESGGAQTAGHQNVAVFLPVEQGGSAVTTTVPAIVVLLVLCAAVYVLIRRRKSPWQLIPANMPADAPIVFTASAVPNPQPRQTESIVKTTPVVADTLAAIEKPSGPAPGTTIMPTTPPPADEENRL